jgi:hypothetical protein
VLQGLYSSWALLFRQEFDACPELSITEERQRQLSTQRLQHHQGREYGLRMDIVGQLRDEDTGSRLILNVTVCTSEPDDHLADRASMKDRMMTPTPLTLLPDRAQVQTFLGMGLGKDHFIGVPHFDERGVASCTVSAMMRSFATRKTTMPVVPTSQLDILF